MGNPKIGIIGHLGSIGSRHYKNFKDLGCEVVGYDPLDINGLSHQDVTAGSDAVVIASPTNQHFSSIQVCNSRKKPMLVEKPIVFTREEASWLENSSLIVMVGYNLRFHSSVKMVRRWLGDGLIGKPIWARFTCAQYNDRKGYRRDGVLLNWSHEIDLAIYLLGDASCSAASILTRYPDAEDTADIIINHYMTGCQTVIHLDYLTRPERRGFVIVGEAGSIECDLVSRQAYCKDADGRIVHTHFGRDNFDSNYVSEAKAFLALLAKQEIDENVTPCSVQDALRVVNICFDAKELARGR